MSARRDRPADRPRDEDSPLADPAMRLAARTIDGLLPVAPLVTLAPLGIALSSPGLIRAALGLMVAVFVAQLALDAWWLYRYGQSIGKRILGLRIVRAGGDRAGFGRLLGLRIVVPGLVEAIPIVGWIFSLVDALFIFSESRRTLHDRIADTIVVDLRRSPDPPSSTEL